MPLDEDIIVRGHVIEADGEGVVGGAGKGAKRSAEASDMRFREEEVGMLPVCEVEDRMGDGSGGIAVGRGRGDVMIGDFGVVEDGP